MKWAILGTGYIAAKVGNMGIRRAGHSIHAVGSRSKDSADAFIQKYSLHNECKAYGSYMEAISDPSVEAVYIALPSSLHKEWTIKAARNKKHVLCEKPVAPTLQDVEEMIKVCEEEGVVFLDGTFWKHHPRTAAMREVLCSQTLGFINGAHSMFSFPNLNAQPTEIRVNPQAEPLGVLGDMAWYTVRFCLFAYNFELPEKVHGHIVRKHPITGAAETFIGYLLYSNQRSASFEASFHQVGAQRSSITGTKGQLTIEDPFLPWKGASSDFAAFESFAAPASDSFQICRGFSNTSAENISVDTAGKIEEEYMVLDFAACVDALKAGKRDIREKKWREETVAIHKVLEALWDSARSDKTVSLSMFSE